MAVPYTFLTVIGLVGLLIFTRVFSASRTKSVSSQNGSKSVPALPYWLPIIGHIPNLVINADGFFKSLRDRITEGIVALNLGGTRHNVIFTPHLTAALFSPKVSPHVDGDAVSEKLMVSVFGFPSSQRKAYGAALHEILACYKHLTSEPYLGDMAAGVSRDLCTNVTDFVTFSASLVDQMSWERNAQAELVTTTLRETVVEANFFQLIRDFCATTAIPTLFGTDLLNNAPELIENLWTYDRGFFLLATGLSRFVPIPGLARAHIARYQCLREMEAFHTALEKHSRGDDPGSKWTSLHDVGSLIQARLPVYQKYNLSIRARAACENALLWASNANSNPLVYWMLHHIYSDPALLATIRAEITPHITILEPSPSSGLPISEPRRLTRLDREGLTTACPVLKSVYIECLRLDTASWSLKVVTDDVVLRARSDGGGGEGTGEAPHDGKAGGWTLRKGEYVHAAHDLHNTDPKYFPDPMTWKAQRHVKFDEVTGEAKGADLGSIRPYGGGSSMCKGRQLALQEVMLFTAAIVALWDISPAKGAAWKAPKKRRAAGVYSPAGPDVRVWVRPRAL